LPTRLDWNVGANEPDALELAAPDESPPSPVAPPWRPSLLTLAAYAGALVLAGILGFGLGRNSVSHAEITLGLETSLALEEMAWKEADLDLFLATLDPAADPKWRDREAQQFAANAPADVSLSLVSSEPSGEDRMLARVRWTDPGGASTRSASYDETRPYRFLGDVWVRSGGE
jgi:hypothetical protein